LESQVLQLRLFTIPFSPRLGGFDDEPLRAFIADKQVHSLESWHFVHEGTPYWSFCVTYMLKEEPPGIRAGHQDAKPDKEHWRKQLKDADWAVYNALREWRKARADEEGIPPYLVFTNEQLSQMILGRVSTLGALGALKQVGPSRVEKYGKDVLRILNGRTRDDQERASGTARADGVDGVPGVAAADDGEVSEETASDADEPDRQPGAGRGDDADGGAIQ